MHLYRNSIGLVNLPISRIYRSAPLRRVDRRRALEQVLNPPIIFNAALSSKVRAHPQDRARLHWIEFDRMRQLKQKTSKLLGILRSHKTEWDQQLLDCITQADPMGACVPLREFTINAALVWLQGLRGQEISLRPQSSQPLQLRLTEQIVAQTSYLSMSRAHNRIELRLRDRAVTLEIE